MKTAQYHYTDSNTWKLTHGEELSTPNLLLVFGNRQKIEESDAISQLKTKFAGAQIIGCTTSGEILDTKVFDGTVTATAIHFDKSSVVSHHLGIEKTEDSFEAGKKIVNTFNHNNLRHIMVLTDGLVVNGSEFVRGMQEELPEGITVTGGLAGDGPDFVKTLVFTHDTAPSSNIIAAVGFYGDSLKLGYASMGGWDSFGMERLVTKSTNNVLYELDDKPALDLYKSFLGEQAQELPASGLLFPLSIRTSEETPIVRTILAVSEAEQSMTFAGDIPQGSYVRLMKANVDRLVDGSMEAAEKSMEGWDGKTPDLAILISCVGRKLVLKQMVEEEVETAKNIFGDTTVTGFYSYGEISPFMKFMKCELHNQTMTVTLISEE